MEIRSQNKQLAINLISSLVTFLLGIGISFFLTPFIVRNLGASAYGFVGLSMQVINYTSLITLALNSMAGRFITIAYIQSRFNDANKYFSSVFYSNIFLSVLILLSMGFCVMYIEIIFDVPEELLVDVKLLFSLLVLNTIIGLLSNIYSIATFIKNRLELSSLRTLIGNIIKAITLFGLFSIFSPKLWFFGISSILVTTYVAFANYRYTKWLTPELNVSRSFFDFKSIKELVSAGIWNVITKIGELLGAGMSLILANLFIGAEAMGVKSLSATVPAFILSVFASISGVFAPSLTQLYAKGQTKELLNELNKSVRILGFLTAIPFVCLITYGYDFYSIWLPTQNATVLETITIISALSLVLCMPLEVLWNIFTITNRVKHTSIFLVFQNFLTFIIAIIFIPLFNSMEYKLYALCIAGSFTSLIKTLFFLPLYGAKCLQLPFSTFYKVMGKSFICFIIGLLPTLFLRFLFKANTWIELIILCALCTVICIIINYNLLLLKTDRAYFKKHLPIIKNL